MSSFYKAAYSISLSTSMDYHLQYPYYQTYPHFYSFSDDKTLSGIATDPVWPWYLLIQGLLGFVIH